MKSPGIRDRILLTVLGPAILVALLVTSVLVIGQMRQAETEQHRRIYAFAHQLAALAEYNLFIGNDEALRKLLEVAWNEPDVKAVAFLDTQGKILASSLPAHQLPTTSRITYGLVHPASETGIEHWHTLPIRATQLAGSDLYSPSGQVDAPPLGQLLLKVSTESLRTETRKNTLKAAGIAAVMLCLALALAIAFSRGLIRTLGAISTVVEGVGLGQHELRVAASSNDELGKLAEGINAMAAAVGQTQEQLAERIVEATATLRRERDAADHAALARSRFFAAASHDLRQPAQALGLLVARLQRENPSPELQPRLALLAKTVTHLQELLGALLDYSRLDGQVLHVEPQPVSAKKAIDQVVGSFAEAAAARKLRLRSRVRDCWLLTDPALLHRILINLIGNAVKHTLSGGVLVTCRRVAGEARIEVWDTGPGIPPESQETIFDELVQLDNPERDMEKGLGLGLAIVRKSAQLLGHVLSLSSNVGKGSRFVLAVPIAAEAGTAEVMAAHERHGVLLIGPRNPDTDQLAALLDDWEIPLERAEGVHAIPEQVVDRNGPRLVVIDLADDATGIEEVLCGLDRIAAETGKVIPALIVSSSPIPSLDAHAGTAPRPFLTRPFRPARLRALVSQLLASQEDLPD